MVQPGNNTPFTGSVPGEATLAAIKTLLDSVLSEIETALGIKLDNIKTVVDDILADTETTLEGKLDTLDLLINAIKAVTDNIPDGGSLTALLTSIASILTDTEATIPGLLAIIQADLDNPDQYKADVAALALETTLGTHDTDIKALLATIAGYLDTEIAAILAAVDTEVAAIETKLDTPANFMADLSTLETRLSDARAGYLDQLDFALQEAIAALQSDLDNPDQYKADLSTLETRLSAIRAGYLDELAAANIPADIDELKASKGRLLQSMDFWSDLKEEVQLDGDVAATIALGAVTIADLPAGATIVRAIAMFKFRMVENIHATIANKLDGATVANTSQVIQVADDTPGTYYDAINFVDDQFSIAAVTREGGDVLVGSVDIAGAGKVDANDGYLFRWLLALADEDYLNFNDVQVGIRIWYSV